MSFTADSTLGAASIGFSVSCVVFGVLTTQVYTYFRRYPSDRVAYKLLVVVLWFFELVDQVFIGHFVYYYTITNFANPLVIITGNVVWSLIAQVMVGDIVGTIVKLCFALRVWRFSNRNHFVTGIILILVFGQFACAILYTVRSFQLGKFIYASRLQTVATVALGAGVLTDIIIALALCFFLRKLRTGYDNSDSLVNTLTIYAINTGALTSAISLCTLVLYNTHPEAFYFTASYFVLGKLYAISLLCTLNTRKTVRGRGTDRAATSNRTPHTADSFYMVTTRGGYHEGHGRLVPALQTKSMEIEVTQDVSISADIYPDGIMAASQQRTPEIPPYTSLWVR